MAHPCASADSRRIHAAHSLQPASRSGRQRAGEPPWLRGECEHVGWAELGEAQRLPRGSFLSLSPFTIKPPHPWVKRPYAMVFGLALSRCGYVDPSAGLLGFALLSPTYMLSIIYTIFGITSYCYHLCSTPVWCCNISLDNTFIYRCFMPVIRDHSCKYKAGNFKVCL